MLERFVGLSTQFEAVLSNDTRYRNEPRSHAAPAWFPGPKKLGPLCRIWAQSETGPPTYWLAGMHYNRSAYCCRSDTIYMADSCFDWLYCHPRWPQNFDAAAARRRYDATPKPDPRWLDGSRLSSVGWGATVAVHFRANDVGARGLRVDYYVRAINALRQELTNTSNRWGGRPPIFRLQTDATSAQFAGLAPILAMGDVVLDAAANSSVSLTFHRMVVADALIMSQSSLSQAAGLLRVAVADDQSTIFPGCWRSERRRHPTWREFACIDRGPPRAG